MLRMPAVFNTVTCYIGLKPRSNRLDHRAQVCKQAVPSRSVQVHSMMFTQQNCLTSHFSECIPTYFSEYKQHTTVHLEQACNSSASKYSHFIFYFGSACLNPRSQYCPCAERRQGAQLQVKVQFSNTGLFCGPQFSWFRISALQQPFSTTGFLYWVPVLKVCISCQRPQDSKLNQRILGLNCAS